MRRHEHTIDGKQAILVDTGTCGLFVVKRFSKKEMVRLHGSLAAE
jgi:hypothetical protein